MQGFDACPKCSCTESENAVYRCHQCGEHFCEHCKSRKPFDFMFYHCPHCGSTSYKLVDKIARVEKI